MDLAIWIAWSFHHGRRANDLRLWKLLERREFESGLGEKAIQEAGLVLHPPQPGLDQRGQLIDVLLDQVGQRPFQVRPDRLSRLVTVHAALDRLVQARRLSAGRRCSGWLGRG